MNVSYTKIGDYLLSDLKLENKERFNISKYGLLKLEYLKKNKRGLYIELLMKDKLNEYLHDVDLSGNAKLSDVSPLGNHRVQGLFVGAGIGYGYAIALAKHFNLEFEIGIGYAYSKFDKYKCVKCDSKIETGKHHHYFGLTKAEIGFVYLF